MTNTATWASVTGDKDRLRGFRLGLGLVAALLFSVWTRASAAERDLTELSLEELMNIEVTSVSKKAEKGWEAPAALYVITGQDLRRSGVTSIPEALRMAPGVHVARIDANKWAVSVRGFSGRFTDKLLVLMDGRSVYTPLFSGVYWDVQDTPLEDVERIEVVRGPGGSLWGANAVNGVINIITRSARDTQGALVTLGGGGEERRFGTIRYGGRIGGGPYYRVYAKYFDRAEGTAVEGNAADDWDVARLGFRADWDLQPGDALTVQGDYYKGDAGQALVARERAAEPTFRADLTGGNVVTRWKRVFGEESAATLQAYYDRTERREKSFTERRDSVDLDFQHDWQPWRRHRVVWGAGYRLTADDIHGDLATVLKEDTRNDQLFSAFVQDEIGLVERRLRLTTGLKLEHNDYSGFEFQPSARLAWLVSARHMFWASVARAVRTPSRAGHEILMTLPLDPRAVGGLTDKSEELTAFELGYRMRVLEDVSLHLATFYNRYDDLSSLGLGEKYTTPDHHEVWPVLVRNNLEGAVYGAEISSEWMPRRWWSLHGSYSFLRLDLGRERRTPDPMERRLESLSLLVEDQSPRHQASVRSYLDLPGDVSLDVFLRYADSLPVPGLFGVRRRTASYFTFDARLAYRPTRGLELALVGQNLAESHHREFSEIDEFRAIVGTEVERSMYGKVTWEF